MTFLSILCALVIEQFKPLRADNPVYAAVRGLVVRMEVWFNAGQASHGRTAWILTMALLVVPAAAIYWALEKLSPVAALLWNVLIVYLTLGFRHYSHYFTAIQLAITAGDEVSARKLLAEWLKRDTSGLDMKEVSRLAVEGALITTHRNVFGVFFWFLLPLGPAGAVMYRLAEHLVQAWNTPEHLQNESFGLFARRAFYWIDWIPARLTAIAFAIVGNFEDAIYAWRNFAHRWKDEPVGIILSAGGGAMGVRLGTPVESAVDIVPIDASSLEAAVLEPDNLPGDDVSPRALQSTVGLVWRALLLWMLLLLFISIASWLG